MTVPEFNAILDVVALDYTDLSRKRRPDFAAVIELAAEVARCSPEDCRGLLNILQARAKDVRARDTMKN